MSQIPIKVTKDANNDTTGLSEFQVGETVGLAYGGTGAVDAAGAVVNLGLSAVATTGSFTDLINKPILRTYRFNVTSASTTWIIQHNKNTSSYSEKLYETNGSRFYAHVETIDANSFKVYLSENITGYVDVLFDEEVLLSA